MVEIACLQVKQVLIVAERHSPAADFAIVALATTAE